MALNSTIETMTPPETSLLRDYVHAEGVYADGFAVTIAPTVPLAGYVYAFYTTRLFKLERRILKIAISKPSTDEDARALASDGADSFAAWHVEGRTETELLMCDIYGSTRSWFIGRAFGRWDAPQVWISGCSKAFEEVR